MWRTLIKTFSRLLTDAHSVLFFALLLKAYLLSGVAESAESHLIHLPENPEGRINTPEYLAPQRNDTGVEQALFQQIPFPTVPEQRPSFVTPLTLSPYYSIGYVMAFAQYGPVPGAGLRRASQIAETPKGAPTSRTVSGSELRALIIKYGGDSGTSTAKKGETAEEAVVDNINKGARVGGNNSYWVPARMDLDTALNKIDGRLIENLTVIRGPYSSRYGPGYSHVDLDLIGSPRYQNRFENHGEIGGSFESNGKQWNGFKSLWGGNEETGYRFDYSHRGGSDYDTGSSGEIPGDFETRTFALALGHDFNLDHSIEIQLLRMDQFDVDLPGQAFDIDKLETNGVDIEYLWTNAEHFDELAFDGWYNSTKLHGDAQNPEKRKIIPFFDLIGFEGFTNVKSESSGYRAEFSWEGDDWRLSAGSDLRHIEQDLDEISDGRFLFTIWNDANSPIPKSHTTNPGLFFDYQEKISESVTVKAGSRVDWFTAQVDDSAADLASVGVFGLPYADVVGSSQLEANKVLWAAYVSADAKISDSTILTLAAGHAERPPNLTELYAAEPFMFLLQNGENIVTGDPRLKPERLWQVDAELKCDRGRFRSRIRGYHKWINDYITFENMGGIGQQTNLKFVNTELATIAGFDADVQYDANDWLTGFSTVSYADGRDRTRNGTFATRPSTGIPVDTPSVRVSGLSRGAFSGITGTSHEPLPGILPLNLALGIRLHDSDDRRGCGEEIESGPRWSVEFLGRIVDNQDRVAASLLESTTPGFTTFDLRSFWRVNDSLTLLGGIENLTDKDYREHLDFRSTNGISVNRPGISFYFGSELTY